MGESLKPTAALYRVASDHPKSAKSAMSWGGWGADALTLIVHAHDARCPRRKYLLGYHRGCGGVREQINILEGVIHERERQK